MSSSNLERGRVLTIYRLILGLTGFLSACASGDGGDKNLSCPNLGISQACSTRTHDGAIYLETSKLKAGEEYMIIAHSEVSPRGNTDLRHPFRYQTEAPSAGRNSPEEQYIKSVWAQDDNGGSGSPLPLPSLGTIPIRVPAGYASMNLDDEFYVPNPDDYVNRTNGEVTPFFQQSPNGEVLSGRKVQPQIFEQIGSNLRFIVDKTLVSSPGAMQDYQNKLTILRNCLSPKISKASSIIGAPISVDGRPDITVMIAGFSGVNGVNAKGLFSERNRYKTLNNNIMEDSNHTQMVFQKPLESMSEACSNDIHEIEHLISYDRKVLGRIPADERLDMDSALRRGYRGEESGIEEANAHSFEEMTGEAQSVWQYQRTFWRDPNLSSFLIEPVFTDAFGNARARGLSKFLIDYAVARAGGSRNWDDPKTVEYFSKAIQSPETGIENIAKQFGLNREQFLQDFFAHLAMSLYQKGYAETFIPPIQQSINLNGATTLRGVEISDRALSPSSIPTGSPQLHPYSFKAPLLEENLNTVMPARGVYFTRYIVPSEIKDSSKVKFSTNGEAFSITLVHVR